MDFRTEQMREALKSEARHQAIASEKANSALLLERRLLLQGCYLKSQPLLMKPIITQRLN